MKISIRGEDMPRLSIIIPVYNCEDYLEKCINSILNQTFDDFELILVNDGSEDSSGSLCDRLAIRDTRITVLHKKNGGAASARNAGLEIARGELIGFIDSDDYIHPQMYEILYEVMQRTGADIASCHYKFVSPEQNEKFDFYDDSVYEHIDTVSCQFILNHFDEYCRRVSLISPCMRLCKVKLFGNLRFKEGYIEEDSILLLPLLEKASSISKVNLPLYFWTENPNSVTRVAFNYKRFAFIQVSYERVQYFEKRNDERLSKIFRREFMNRCVAFGLKAEETGLQKEFDVYSLLYKKRFLKYILASDLCKMEILMHTLFFLHIPYYKQIYRRLKPVDEMYLK